MSWTSTSFYMTLLLAVMTVFTTLALVGDELVSNDRVTLNGKSLDYVSTLKGVSSSSEFDSIANISSGVSSEEGILDSSENASVASSSDFLSTLYIKKERADQPVNLFNLVYNIPSSIITSLGLPLSGFQHIINIFSYILLAALLIMFWTKIIRT